MARAGFEVSASELDADLIVYNTCAVKEPTENRMISALRRISLSKKVVVAGCLPLINFERLSGEARFDGVVGPAAGDRIVDVVRRVFKGERIVALNDASVSKPSLALPRVRMNPVISIIPVNYGCLGSCAYCCAVFARGQLRSYDVDEILQRVKRDLADGVKEIWLTSQDTASYGKDKGTSIAELLKAVCSIEGDFKVRVGMMTPSVATDFLENLMQAYQSEKVFKFVHLPVQSGSDQVLKHMHRLYSIDDFKGAVETLRTSFPEITVSTDVICGFLGETDEAFRETLSLIREVKPDMVNISKFFARPRTLAARMTADAVPLQIIKHRSSVAAKLVKEIALERNRRWIGWTGQILVDEVGRISGTWIGRNFAYKPVVIRKTDNILGKTVLIRVVRVFFTHLEGEVV